MNYEAKSIDDFEKELAQRCIEFGAQNTVTSEAYALTGMLGSYLALKETSNARTVGAVVLLMIHALGYEIRKPVEEA